MTSDTGFDKIEREEREPSEGQLTTAQPEDNGNGQESPHFERDPSLLNATGFTKLPSQLDDSVIKNVTQNALRKNIMKNLKKEEKKGPRKSSKQR